MWLYEANLFHLLLPTAAIRYPQKPLTGSHGTPVDKRPREGEGYSDEVESSKIVQLENFLCCTSSASGTSEVGVNLADSHSSLLLSRRVLRLPMMLFFFKGVTGGY